MLWIWVTIGAALGQTVRGAYQKKLKAPLGDLGASYVRFSYALPFAWAWVAGYAIWSGEPLPGVTFTFLAWTTCLLYTSPSPRDQRGSRMPSSA